jgi:hypothetical protein
MLVLSTCCGLGLASAGEATPLTFEYFAQVSSVDDPDRELAGVGLLDGAMIKALVSIDPDLFSMSFEEFYYGDASAPAGQITVTSGGLVIRSSLLFTSVTRSADSVNWHFEYEDVTSNSTTLSFDSIVIELLSQAPGDVPQGAALFDYFNPALWNGGHLSFDACCDGLGFFLSAEMKQTRSVPEPATWLLCGLGITGATLVRRKLGTSRRNGSGAGTPLSHSHVRSERA